MRDFIPFSLLAIYLKALSRLPQFFSNLLSGLCITMLAACSSTPALKLPTQLAAQKLQSLPNGTLFSIQIAQEQRTIQYQSAQNPKANLILLPGKQFIGSDGITIIGGELDNFLAKGSKILNKAGFNTLLPSCPKQNCTEEKGKLWYDQNERQQAQVVAYLTAFIKQQNNLPVWLLASGEGIKALLHTLEHFHYPFAGVILLTEPSFDFDPDTETTELQTKLNAPLLVIDIDNSACLDNTTQPHLAKIITKNIIKWNKQQQQSRQQKLQRCIEPNNSNFATTIDYDSLKVIGDFIKQNS